MPKKILFTFLIFLAACAAHSQSQAPYAQMIGGAAEEAKKTPQYTYLYDTSLTSAVKNNDADRIKLLMYANVDPNEKNDEGFTPLVLAAEKVLPEVIRLMLQHGAKVNMPSKYNVTPLIAAAAANRLAVVKLLLEYGADPNMKDDFAMTALMHAVKNKNHTVVSALTEVMHKSGIDAADKDNISPALYAAKNNDIQTLSILAKTGADLNVKDELGKTPLILATGMGNISLVRDLLAAGANTENKDNAGRTALMHAVQGGYAAITALLISNKADIETTDLIASTPLILAAKEKNNKITADLVKAGADVNAQDRLGRTPLIWALNNNDYPTFNILLSSPALNVDFIYGDDAHTPLIAAVKDKNYRMVSALIKHGANANIKDKFDRPAVIYALENEDYPSFNAIISSPSFAPDLSYGEDRSTPLIAAVRRQDYKSVAALLNKSAGVNQEDIFNNAPLYYALQNNDEKIINLLIKNGAAQEPPAATESPVAEENAAVMESRTAQATPQRSIVELDRIIAELEQQLDRARKAKANLEKQK
jgi:ankyrin repeat protein